MAPASQSSFSAVAPAWDALRRPLQILLQPSRRTPDGRIYLGQGQPVFLFPVPEAEVGVMAGLRRNLVDAGFEIHDCPGNRWPRGASLKHWVRELEERVIDVFENARSSVSLLGWGLSGIYAREVAKRTNPLVRQVITLGTPFNAAADPQHGRELMRQLAISDSASAIGIQQRLRQCPPVPFTSLYSKADGVVPWELCLEKEAPEAENIEIEGATHAGLADHPRALEIITHRLAQAEGEWRPFEAARLL